MYIIFIIINLIVCVFFKCDTLYNKAMVMGYKWDRSFMNELQSKC